MARIFISAGEASGDLHAARLMEELRRRAPEIGFTFLGGDRMAAAAGHAPLIHYKQMAFMAFSEVLRNLPTIGRNLTVAKKVIDSERPDAIILVDYPGFNMKLAAHAAKRGIPVFYYIPPKVWAWKTYRVKALKKYTSAIYCILPFEPEFYRSHGVETAVYSGNPSREEVDGKMATLCSRSEFIAAHNLTGRPMIALVPGSRVGEIRNNLPIMTAVAARHRDMQAVVAGAPGIDRSIYRRYTTLPVVDNETFELMAHSQVALVTSGTASLECALIGTPQVVLYRANGSRFSYNLFKKILKVSYVSLPNLIVDRGVVPEQLLHHCNVEEVDAALAPLLDDGAPAREAQLAGYREMRGILGAGDMASTTAEEIIRRLSFNGG
ncbi:MAG: lipid-A-disaccharide synthase [Muribaculaceae bacterium]|nr:lipid-A-disaccharide synthase [Muribaculaceae bacterium]